jgi:hypothetical protein
MTYREWLFQITEPNSIRLYKTVKMRKPMTVKIACLTANGSVLVWNDRDMLNSVRPESLYFPDNPDCAPVYWEAGI